MVLEGGRLGLNSFFRVEHDLVGEVLGEHVLFIAEVQPGGGTKHTWWFKGTGGTSSLS